MASVTNGDDDCDPGGIYMSRTASIGGISPPVSGRICWMVMEDGKLSRGAKGLSATKQWFHVCHRATIHPFVFLCLVCVPSPEICKEKGCRSTVPIVVMCSHVS